MGNAGNIIRDVWFLKMYLWDHYPVCRAFWVQSEHADPVYRYSPGPGQPQWQPVQVTPSVAQAAMIGNPVSFPRVAMLAEKFIALGGEKAFQVVQVTEQQIMDAMIGANRKGHIACTQGGECLAGLLNAKTLGLIGDNEHAVLDATAHALKFLGFQDMYFSNTFPRIWRAADTSLANTPELLLSAIKSSHWTHMHIPSLRQVPLLLN